MLPRAPQCMKIVPLLKGDSALGERALKFGHFFPRRGWINQLVVAARSRASHIQWVRTDNVGAALRRGDCTRGTDQQAVTVPRP